MNDTKRLEALMIEVIDLLYWCNSTKERKWWESRLRLVRKDLPGALEEIADNLGGAGSFADLSLTPRGAYMLRKEAAMKQVDLVRRLGQEIDKLNEEGK